MSLTPDTRVKTGDDFAHLTSFNEFSPAQRQTPDVLILIVSKCNVPPTVPPIVNELPFFEMNGAYEPPINGNCLAQLNTCPLDKLATINRVIEMENFYKISDNHNLISRS